MMGWFIVATAIMVIISVVSAIVKLIPYLETVITNGATILLFATLTALTMWNVVWGIALIGAGLTQRTTRRR